MDDVYWKIASAFGAATLMWVECVLRFAGNVSYLVKLCFVGLSRFSFQNPRVGKLNRNGQIVSCET
jgi:hypothetical protein